MKITWFGHSAFALEAGGKKLLIDPFLSGNPTFNAGAEGAAAKARYEAAIAGTTHVVLTHGHNDHVGDVIDICRRHKPVVFSNYDLGVWLMGKIGNGGDGAAFELMNSGGTVESAGVSVTLTKADHSSGEIENGNAQALGLPNGAIIRMPGAPVVWHLGDTDIYSDMKLFNDLHKPEVVCIPIGDRFTMGPRTAAYAATHFLTHARTLLPCHWGTFGLLTGTPEAFRKELGAAAGKVADLTPGVAITV